MPTMIRFHEGVQDLMVSAEAIQPDPRNPNNGDIDAIIESITVNGVYRPVYAAKSHRAHRRRAPPVRRPARDGRPTHPRPMGRR
jgi:hypothetical protein